MINTPVILTDRLFLRPIELGDAAATAALISPRISEHSDRWPLAMTISEAIDFIGNSRCSTTAGEWVDWGIFMKEDLHLIGWVGLGRGDRDWGAVKIDGWVGDIFQRQHFGTEALVAVVSRIADIFGAHAVEAAIPRNNASGIGLLRKIGFEIESQQHCDPTAPFSLGRSLRFRLDLAEFASPACSLLSSLSTASA